MNYLDTKKLKYFSQVNNSDIHTIKKKTRKMLTQTMYGPEMS